MIRKNLSIKHYICFNMCEPSGTGKGRPVPSSNVRLFEPRCLSVASVDQFTYQERMKKVGMACGRTVAPHPSSKYGVVALGHPHVTLGFCFLLHPLIGSHVKRGGMALGWQPGTSSDIGSTTCWERWCNMRKVEFNVACHEGPAKSTEVD
jgi:hypothetical protein